MDYKKYLEDRLGGMYSIIESNNSVLLEDYKKVKNNKLKKAVSQFYKFLKDKHPKKAKECEKDPNKLVKMIKNKSKEFDEFTDKNPWVIPLFVTVTFAALSNIAMGVIAGVLASITQKDNGGYNANDHIRRDQEMIAAYNMGMMG